MSSRALIISAQEYKTFPALKGPDADATAFEKWLKNADPSCQIEIVKGQAGNAGTPTFSEVNLAISRWAAEKRANRGRPIAKRGYIYYSGHGIAPAPDDAQMVTAEANHEALFGVSGRAIANYLEKGGFFEELVLIMDCCRDDSPSAPIPFLLTPIDDPLPKGTKRFMAFATSFPLKSKEQKVPPRNDVRGLFTVALIEGLEGKAPRSSSGAITGKSINDYVLNRLPDLIASNPVNGLNARAQSPKFEPADSDMAFGTTAVPGQKIVITFRNDQVGHRIRVLFGANRVVAETTVLGATWEVPLDSGIYFVIDVDSTDLADQKPARLVGEDTHVIF